MNEVEILKQNGYTLQELGVLSFYTEEIEKTFQDAYIGMLSVGKHYTQKQLENEYSYYISKKVVRRYYNDKCS